MFSIAISHIPLAPTTPTASSGALVAKLSFCYLVCWFFVSVQLFFFRLHRPHSKKAKVAEIAHKFSFSEGSSSKSQSTITTPGPREDALSASTSARLQSTQQHTPAPNSAGDRLVAQTAMRTKTETTTLVDGHVTSAYVPPPPPPPGIGPVPPPPPPPPPIVPPTDKVVMRKRLPSKDKQKKKKPETSGPQVSMAEVMNSLSR